MPANLDLEIWQGDAQNFTITLTDSNSVALNLAGYTAHANIRQSFTAQTEYSFACSISSNTVTIYMSSTTCATIPPGSYVWDFGLTAGNGDVRTYLAGDCTVLAKVDL
jgi:hypothetical protein